MAVDRLTVSEPGSPAPTPARGGSDAIGPVAGAPRIYAPCPVGGGAAPGPRRSPPEADSVDPVSEIAALAVGRSAHGTASGLAAQLLDYVAPRPRNTEAFSQARILPLLGLAADHLEQVSQSSGALGTLGAKALEQELRHHRDLAARRSNRLET